MSWEWKGVDWECTFVRIKMPGQPLTLTFLLHLYLFHHSQNVAQIIYIHLTYNFLWTQFYYPSLWPEKSLTGFCWHLFSAQPFLTCTSKHHISSSSFERYVSLLTLKRTAVSPQLCGIIYYLFLPCVINGDSLCPASAGLTCRQWTLRRSQQHTSIHTHCLCKHTHTYTGINPRWEERWHGMENRIDG